tara:strand:+ start:95 stop:478 length:384 start_codon:yes stop_codon:yes gene_type:complete
MYRSLYLLSVPEDKTVIRSGFSSLLNRGKDTLPPQQHHRGDNRKPEPYQLDPNDDDMSRLQETAPTYEYREERQERDDATRWNVDREMSEWLERDREMNEQFEREYERDYDRLEDFYEYASRSAYHN